MSTYIPGPGEDGYAIRAERAYCEAHPDELKRLLAEEADEAPSPLISNDESYALYLGSRALAEVAAGLAGRGQHELAAESARSAAALDDLQRRSTVAAARGQSAEQEADR
jgi:hypothetical protein